MLTGFFESKLRHLVSEEKQVSGHVALRYMFHRQTAIHNIEAEKLNDMGVFGDPLG